MIFLDTHVLVWLYEGLTDKFSKKTQTKLETETLVISPMVELELSFLHEIGQISVNSATIIRYLDAHLDIKTSRVDFNKVIEESHQHTWTGDPFDRVIVAHASLFQAPLLTKDEKVQQHYQPAFWS
jgi:PIN domain nuclease of toxin-antitoxin system